MSQLRVIAPDLKAGIDRKLLKTLKQRFVSINSGRLERMLAPLSHQHRVFVESLPLLLHTNHPSLPGYHSPETPCGISGFTPEAHNLRAARHISRSFHYRRKNLQKERIFSVFLMGSTGTVAHSDASDMDIWICHDPALSPLGLELLQRKLTAIEVWADDHGLEVHFFLMNPDAFRAGVRGDLNGEDCGSTQHYMLLDEFYRTSIMVAGRYPLWWMVPTYEEQNYDEIAQTLLSKRFVRPEECIDFGGISEFPAGEFVGAGLWQLYKGIDSPYKSVIKIILAEVYASEYPATECLSLTYKRSVYAGQSNLDELDPYVMLYRRIEHYLQTQQQSDRLELIRRCFYFKVQQKLSQTVARHDWRYQLVQRLVTEWQWDAPYLKHLDQRRRWPVREIQAQRKRLVRELTFSYRFLSQFARDNHIEAVIQSRDVDILSHKLFAAFERKPGKLECSHAGFSSGSDTQHLSFVYQQDEENAIDHHWALHDDYVLLRDCALHQPLMQTPRLVELIAWAYFNQILGRATRLSVDAPSQDLNEHELVQIAQTFFRQFPAGMPHPPQANFEQPKVIESIALYVDVGLDPLKSAANDGRLRLSDQSDALSYSAFHQNLVQSIDVIRVNSWGEVFCEHFSGEHALLDFLAQYLQRETSEPAPPKPAIHCFCPHRALSIGQRLEALFDALHTCFFDAPAGHHARYLLELGTEHYLIEHQSGHPEILALEPTSTLPERLRLPRRTFSPLVIDAQALKAHPLTLVAQEMRADLVQVFYHRQQSSLTLYVADERGSLYITQRAFHSEQTVFNSLSHFLENIVRYRQLKRDAPAIRFREIVRRRDGRLVCRAYSGELDPLRVPYRNLKAAANRSTFGETVYTLTYNGREYSHFDYGAALYETVAAEILEDRASHETYPCYLTDLDLTGITPAWETGLQTIHYLDHKDRIEREINTVLGFHE